MSGGAGTLLVEQVEVAVPVRVGLGQVALEFVGQGQVLVQARVVGGAA